MSLRKWLKQQLEWAKYRVEFAEKQLERLEAGTPEWIEADNDVYFWGRYWTHIEKQIEWLNRKGTVD